MVPPGYVDYISHHQELSTWADFHQNFTGTFPHGLREDAGVPGGGERVVFANPLPMPPFTCTVEGEPGHQMTDADRMLLADWLAAGAPDGASWP